MAVPTQLAPACDLKEALAQVHTWGQESVSGVPITVPDGSTYTTIPDGHDFHDLEQYADRPRRLKQNVLLLDIEGFVGYVNRFKHKDTIIIATDHGAVAHINYHGADGIPSWDAHICALELSYTDAWKKWSAAHGKAMGQEEFAQFLEANSLDISEPDGAELLEAVTKFETTSDCAFESRVDRTSGGLTFRYKNEASQVGTIKVPKQLLLDISIYKGSAPQHVVAVIRWRHTDGKLRFWIDLIQIERDTQAARGVIVNQIKEGTQVPLFS